jgi:hypothetical protein
MFGLNSRPFENQRIEPIYRLSGRPSHSSQDEHAEEGIVKGPSVMSGDADEDAPFADLMRP